MKPEHIYTALHLCSVPLPPDPDPQSSRVPTPKTGLLTWPLEWPNIKIRHFNFFGSESDYLMLSTYTGVVAEYEIKVTKSDLLRECRIARAAREANQSTVVTSDKSKFEKHSSFYNGRTLPPNYYSMVVPEALLDTCMANAPEYAGIYRAEVAQSTSWVSIKAVRSPTLISSVKADTIFFARCAERLFRQLSSLHQAAGQIKIASAVSRRKYLMDIARSICEAEIQIAQSGRSDEATKRFLVERAVSGLSQRDKNHVARYYWSGEFLMQAKD